MIALRGLLWPDEIRDPTQATPGPVRLEEGEKIDQALALIEVMRLPPRRDRDSTARAAALRTASV
ncbi:hypothetical protein [Streptomyces sp. NPDC093598]|uniref:hypothetical protein n=1 Tax=Streptomyces sp. NPDC093598 TaxID=3366046 RepID=UPI003828BDEF